MTNNELQIELTKVTKQRDNCAHLIRRLCRICPQGQLWKQALEYLERNELDPPNILRKPE